MSLFNKKCTETVWEEIQESMCKHKITVKREYTKKFFLLKAWKERVSKEVPSEYLFKIDLLLKMFNE